MQYGQLRMKAAYEQARDSPSDKCFLLAALCVKLSDNNAAQDVFDVDEIGWDGLATVSIHGNGKLVIEPTLRQDEYLLFTARGIHWPQVVSLLHHHKHKPVCKCRRPEKSHTCVPRENNFEMKEYLPAISKCKLDLM